MKKVMLSAIQPSNTPTLGTYLGALKNWVQMQDQYDCLFFAVDMHSITVRQDPKQLRDLTQQAIAIYLASGLKPDHCTLFAQSHVPAHAELGWVLTCTSYMGELNRMTQFKDKSGKQGQNIPTGLYVYPALMAADILLYKTNLVPVGADQKQHVELTRDLAMRFNNTYGETFVVPEPFIPPIGARIMSLQNPESKMSKSDPDPNATIFILDEPDTIVKKLKKAVTDSGSEITDADDKPGVRNLLSIQSALSGKPVAEIVASYIGKQYGHLKLGTAEMIVETLRPIRTKALELLSERNEIDAVLKVGADKANAKAAPMMTQVYDRLGFVPRTR
jgi:tryptophanyl-tRNA synthetase